MFTRGVGSDGDNGSQFGGGKDENVGGDDGEEGEE